MRVLAFLCVKNEASFLLEWLAHHRGCGFTDFLVFSNDCDDGTDIMLDRLAAMGWLTHVRNDGAHPEGPQWAALKQADRHPLRAAADWVIVLDIDEFVNVHVGDCTVAALLAALPQATAIPLTWRLFGNAGMAAYDGAPVTQTFRRAAPSALHWPWRGSMMKTLHRNDGTYARLGVHRPLRPDPERLEASVWVDGSGRRLPDIWRTERLFTPPGQDCHALVQLNHYALGSMAGFVVKRDRGRANRAGAPFDMDYWTERNFCDVKDVSILRLDSATSREELLADAVLGPLHQAGVAWRQARFRALMRDEGVRALYGRLAMTPPARVLTQSEATAIRVFAQG